MQRGMFSIYDKAYDFVRQLPQERQIFLPAFVQNEILVSPTLLPLLTASLDRDSLDEWIATGVSQVMASGNQLLAGFRKIVVICCV